jgi:hypothetical protein
MRQVTRGTGLIPMPLWLTVCLVVVVVLAVIGVIAYSIDRLNHQVTRHK